MSDHSTNKKVRYKSLAFLGFPGYRVGDDGSVWSCIKRRSLGLGSGAGVVLSKDWKSLSLKNVSKQGRVLITLHYPKGGVRTFSVHRLVLEAFVGPCPAGMEACHFPDRDPTNNRLANLQWNTHLENEKHKKIHGTSVGNRGNCWGELQGSSKLTVKEVVNIRNLFANGTHTQTELATIYKTSQGVINGIVLGKSWKRAGGPITKVGQGGNRKSRTEKARQQHENSGDQ